MDGGPILKGIDLDIPAGKVVADPRHQRLGQDHAACS
jgi:hypothetical protein